MHLTVMTYYSLIIKGILIPLLMLIFGLWSVKNVRGVRQITSVSVVSGFSTAITRRTHTNHSKDRQLLRILLMDITVYLIFNGMIAIVLMYRQINGNKSMTLVEMQVQSLLSNIGVFSTYIPFCIGCYTNVLVSKTFRQEIKNILLCK